VPTTVHFASNRVLTGPADSVGSYSTDIQPPSLSHGMTYGMALVDGIDLATDTPGVITEIQDTGVGGWAQEAIGDLSQPGRNLLVFVHGFDNSFSDAITRAALNREWLAASGVLAADTTVVAFSWPSLGKIVSFPILQGDYLHDQQKARLSGVHLMTFFAQSEPILRAARANTDRTILLAHSMGNLALESAVENWFAHGKGDAPLFDVTVLAAADCGYDAFDQPNRARLSGLGRLSERVSIYYSHADHILQLSQFVNAGAQRLGQDGPRHRLDSDLFPPDQYRMVDATQASDYAVDFLTSHQYYRLSPSVRTQIAADMAGVSTLVA
jgi:esterase/lipase superfamily enzyme